VIRYHARWVVPVTTPPINDGTVAVDAGRIVYVGPRSSAPAGADDDLGDVILMPGLVNAHCHLELTAMRGFLEDLDFRRWILRLVTAKRAVMTRDSLLDAARWGLEEGVRAGITTYGDTCDSGVAMRAMRDAGVRGVMFQEVFGPDPAQCDGAMAELRERVGALRYLETPLVQVGISPHAPYTVSDALFRAAVGLAREQGLPMAIHIAESDHETLYVAQGTGPFADALRARGIDVAPRAASPIRLLADLGVLAVNPLLIHCLRADAGDIQLISDARASVAHCPVSNAKLGHGIAPLVELLACGIAVGLGSDSMASNNRMNMLEEARIALLMQRARLGVFETPGAQEALELATIGGARALRLDDLTGSLDAGKSADLAAFALDPVGPLQDPMTAAVFSLGAAPARFVAVAGRPLVRDGELLSPQPGLAGRIQATADELRAWLASGGELRLDP
jgi:cytosine/adenosine deaminase-related metal-dependent hydrolase